MNIAIIGSGNVGSTLAKGFQRQGHVIVLGVRDKHSFKGSSLLSLTGVSAATIPEACVRADIIVVAADAAATGEICQQLGDVSDKIIIDAMNSFRKKPEGFATSTHALVALTNSKHIVKCFNTTGAAIMADPVFPQSHVDMFLAGTSERAKNTARQLCLELGFGEVYDLGGEEKFELLEHVATFWIGLAFASGNGRSVGLKILKR